eukprot:XP_001704416.1 Hypothetical protein GL50803_24292 [Giardia lamblia ATCC 50803]
MGLGELTGQRDDPASYMIAFIDILYRLVVQSNH